MNDDTLDGAESSPVDRDVLRDIARATLASAAQVCADLKELSDADMDRILREVEADLSPPSARALRKSKPLPIDQIDYDTFLTASRVAGLRAEDDGRRMGLPPAGKTFPE